MSHADDAEYLERRADALHVLRAARRRNRIANVDLFEAFYKTYVGAVLGGIALYAAAGWLGDEPLSAQSLDTLRVHGADYLGLFVALAVAIALRSGGCGGPLAFEAPEIRHVLLAPVDRRDSVRAVASRSLRHAAFIGVTLGAAGGVLAIRRTPDNPVLWIACAALFGMLTALVCYGAALVAGGRRIRSGIADALALVALAWSVADLFVRPLDVSPFAMIAGVALWPLEFRPLGLAGAVVALGVAAWGKVAVDGIAIETAERRAKLVGQLRFAATMQDVRTVMLIQRQLAQQHMRQRPWLRMRSATGTKPGVSVFVRRSLHGLLRWPLARALRLIALCAAAGASVIGVWLGTSPLIVVAGLALWLAALDLVEPLAQEADHPDRTDASPMRRGIVHVRHLVVPTSVLLLLVTFAMLPALLLGPPEVAAALAPLVMPVTLLAIGGAALVVTRPQTTPGIDLLPEVAGVKLLWRLVVPPALPIFGFLPLVIARGQWQQSPDLRALSEAINLPVAAGLAFSVWALLWIRYGDEMRARFYEASATK